MRTTFQYILLQNDFQHTNVVGEPNKSYLANTQRNEVRHMSVLNVNMTAPRTQQTAMLLLFPSFDITIWSKYTTVTNNACGALGWHVCLAGTIYVMREP